MEIPIDGKHTRIAILGAGPSGLFLYKRLLESGNPSLDITIIERRSQIGSGMPYSSQGAGDEHITNVSCNEIPLIVTSIQDWMKSAPRELLERFHINAAHFSEYRVLPRLLFGYYLAAQFDLLLDNAKKAGLTTTLLPGTNVTDIIDQPEQGSVSVEINGKDKLTFDRVVICTGHNWPSKHEGTVPGYFDSPYPPAKLKLHLNHPVAIRGSSLTAIDAIRTIARSNGVFSHDQHGDLSYTLSSESPDFKIVMHSRNGMLPAVRFHLEDSHLSNDGLLSKEQLAAHIKNNDGFLSLDYAFEKDFKELFREDHADFYDRIKFMTLEEFVSDMMNLREHLDPFLLLKAEYAEAAKSIKRKESIYWKEMLGVLSFAMNYPAKYLSGEDMLRLQQVLMPLIAIVIAYVPQSSCEELLALHQAGVLDMVMVGADSLVVPEPSGGAVYQYTDDQHQPRSVHFQTFIDCVGQPHLAYDEFPFKSMLSGKVISPARIRFRSAENGASALQNGHKNVLAGEDGTYYLEVPGITINDCFQVIDLYGACNDRIYVMAVPYIGGFNPDYSGLDFCQEAAGRIVASIPETQSLKPNKTL